MPRWGVVAPREKVTEHFHYQEMACRHCGRIPSRAVIEDTCKWLEKVRAALGGHIIHINSGARCPLHNKNVGGVKNSLHVQGWAADVTLRDLSPREVQRRCKVLQEKGLIGGLGSYDSFTHLDRGPRRAWFG